MMQLTKTLASLDFGLDLELPSNRLCPPVCTCLHIHRHLRQARRDLADVQEIPNRHNYILWLKRLTDSTSYSPPGGPLLGIDIGTGASCIYPLLGACQRPWSFIATELDSENMEHAKANVERNTARLGDCTIETVEGKPDRLIPKLDSVTRPIAFIMTNPPFYSSDEELIRCAAEKDRPPLSACTGAAVEMVTPGGEVEFVGKLIQESMKLGEAVQWYTAMVGKLSSVETLVDRLRNEARVRNWAVTEFVQGNRTRRWAVGWSCGAMRPSQDVCRGMKAAVWGRLLPPATEHHVVAMPSWDGSGGPSDVGRRICDAVQGLDVAMWDWDAGKLRGVGRTAGNVWGRAYRRRRMARLAEEGERVGGTAAVEREREQEVDAGFGFRIEVRIGVEETKVWCRWVEGFDETVYESFRGWLKRKVEGG